MSVPLSNTAIRSCPMFPSLPASGSMCTCVKPRAAFFFMRGSGRGVGGVGEGWWEMSPEGGLELG